MDSKSRANENNDIPKVGEVINLGTDTDSQQNGSNGASQSDSSNGSDAADDILSIRPRRRKSVGSRMESIRAKMDSGAATDEERADYDRWESKRRGKTTSSPPPKDDSRNEADPKVNNTNKSWRAKYGDHDGRELICATFAEYIFKASTAMANYIADNGGSPVIRLDGYDIETTEEGIKKKVPTTEQTNWAKMLVLAMDDILPPQMSATPAIIASAGTMALLLQGTVVAYKKKQKTAPQRPLVRSEEERAKAAKNANATPTPQEPATEPKKEEAKAKGTDREGNRVV